MKNFIIFSLVVISTLASSGFADAKAMHGALAVVPGQGREFHGLATAETAKAAQRLAIKKCGNQRCVIIQKYMPGQCIHTVVGQRQIFWNDMLFSQREKAFVLEYCMEQDRQCDVTASLCLPE